jgi:hypothetical protein
MSTTYTSPLRYTPVGGAKAESASSAMQLRAKTLLPPRDIDGKQRNLICFAKATAISLKLPTVLADDKVAAWAGKRE